MKTLRFFLFLFLFFSLWVAPTLPLPLPMNVWAQEAHRSTEQEDRLSENLTWYLESCKGLPPADCRLLAQQLSESFAQLPTEDFNFSLLVLRRLTQDEAPTREALKLLFESLSTHPKIALELQKNKNHHWVESLLEATFDSWSGVVLPASLIYFTAADSYRSRHRAQGKRFGTRILRLFVRARRASLPRMKGTLSASRTFFHEWTERGTLSLASFRRALAITARRHRAVRPAMATLSCSLALGVGKTLIDELFFHFGSHKLNPMNVYHQSIAGEAASAEGKDSEASSLAPNQTAFAKAWVQLDLLLSELRQTEALSLERLFQILTLLRDLETSWDASKFGTAELAVHFREFRADLNQSYEAIHQHLVDQLTLMGLEIETLYLDGFPEATPHAQRVEVIEQWIKQLRDLRWVWTTLAESRAELALAQFPAGQKQIEEAENQIVALLTELGEK